MSNPLNGLRAAMSRRIQRYQANEIARLATDVTYANLAVKSPFYSEIGRWLDCESHNRVLEIGCGPGRYAAMLGRLGFNVIAADLFTFPTWELLRQLPNVRMMAGVDASDLPYPDASFDAVTCMGALLYFESPEGAMEEISRVLRPGGRLIVRTVNSMNYYRLARDRNIDPATRNVYTENELAVFLRGCGYDVHETSTFGFYPAALPTVWWFLVNGILSIQSQTFLSDISARAKRVNINAYATKKV